MLFDEVIWVLLAAGLVLATPVLAIAGFVQARRARRELAALRADLAAGRFGPAQPAAEVVTYPLPAREESRPTTPEVSSEVPPEVQAEPPLPPEPEPAALAGPTAIVRRSLEENLTSRWLVWLGGATLALGGAFLVKLSIDSGLLGPAVRLTLAVLIGAALVGFSEWLRRRSPPDGTGGRRDFVPAALSAAGLCMGFAAVFAGHALYGLLPALVAFAGLAAIALSAIFLALLQGPFVAALGIAGGYLVPALMSSEEPSAWPLFLYLLVVAAAGAGVLRWRGWAWLAVLNLAGAVAWPFLWFVAGWSAGDAVPVGLYLLGLAAMMVWLRPPALLPAVIGAAAICVVAFALVRTDHYGAASLVILVLLSLLFCTAARIRQEVDVYAVLPPMLVTALLATWHLPQILYASEVRPPIVPPELEGFVFAAAGFAVAFAAGGFLALWGARRPGLWAAVSAGAPIALLAVAYWRLADFELDLSWAGLGLVLALLQLAAAARTARYRDRGLEPALAAYAAGVALALALAATMALREAWLTVALSLVLPAFAWIAGRVDLPALRWLTALFAQAVLVRLVFNPYVLDYDLTIGVGPVNWLLWGYGVPAVAMFVASRRFAALGAGALAELLRGGTLVLTVLLVSLQIRHLTGSGELAAPFYPLAEQGLHAAAWLGIALLLFRLYGGGVRTVVVTWGWRILGGLAAAQLLVLHLIVDNPLLTGVPVGDRPILNDLLFAFGVPAVLAGLFAGEARRQGLDRFADIVGGAALLLAFAWISLEIRRSFHGTVLSAGADTEAELYAYSAAWLAFGGLLLGLALWRHSAGLRYASLAVVLLVVAKVFIVDMSELEGIYRVLSFMGLGAALIGIGWLYQRFVFLPAKAPEAGAA